MLLTDHTVAVAAFPVPVGSMWSSDGQPKQLTKEHMKRGVNEEGERIRMFTSALTSERCVKAGIGKFQYNGEWVETTKVRGGRAVDRVISGRH